MEHRYRLVLDENVEHEVFHRLENYGHDVEHADFVSELGKGAGDLTIAAYSLATDRMILTYDDDFVLDISEDDYLAALYVSDATLSPRDVADIVHEMSRYYVMEEINGVEHVNPVWL